MDDVRGTSRPRHSALRTVALAAAAIRLLYLADHLRSAFFTVPVLDAKHFDLFARALAAGTVPAELATGFRGSFYPLLLTPLYRLSSDFGIVLAQIVQHAAGVVTAVVAAELARRLFLSDRAAIGSGLAYALAPVPLFFEGELLVESLFVACLALLLLAGAAAAETVTNRRTDRLAVTVGILLAVAAQMRPNAWLLLAAVPWAAVRGRRLRSTALAAVPFALVTAALAVAQAPFTGGPKLVPTAGGVNLYLGNRRGADGLVPRPEFAVTHGGTYRDSVETFANAASARAAATSGSEASGNRRYWLTRTWQDVAADPLGRLALVGRKALVVVWNGEVPNNRDFAFVAGEESRMLRWMPARFGVLFALAVLGLAAAPPRAARSWILAVATLHALGVVVFFVADRYRLPLYLPAAIFAGGGAAALLDAVASRDRRRTTRLAALTGAAVLVSFVDWTGARASLPGRERDLYFRSIAWAETGDPARALADARRAAALDADDPFVQLQVAVCALALDQLADAEAALARAASLAPHEPRILNAGGILLERRGEPSAALDAYRAAVAIAPDFAPARANAAWTALLLGDEDEARRHLAALEPWPLDDPRLLVAGAELARRSGDEEDSARWRAAARELDSDAVDRLEYELAKAPSVGASSASGASRP